jgi:hypothetical protein
VTRDLKGRVREGNDALWWWLRLLGFGGGRSERSVGCGRSVGLPGGKLNQWLIYPWSTRGNIGVDGKKKKILTFRGRKEIKD